MAGTPREHFDIAMSKRQAAVAFGAIEITRRELTKMTIANREEFEAPTRSNDQNGDAADV